MVLLAELQLDLVGKNYSRQKFDVPHIESDEFVFELTSGGDSIQLGEIVFYFWDEAVLNPMDFTGDDIYAKWTIVPHATPSYNGDW